MVVGKAVMKRPATKYARLNSFQRGMVFMGFVAGLSLTEISEHVEKEGGTVPVKQTMADTIAHAQANGGALWDGELRGDAGRPRETSDALDKKITKIVFQKRGSNIVTAKYIRKVVHQAREVGLRTIQRRIREAGLRWLRRRSKSLVPVVYRADRLEWAVWVSQRTAAHLSQWAFTNGTSFYLARTDEEHEDKRRLALGTYVWRAANGHDALFGDCVGPSSYAKAQGKVVRLGNACGWEAFRACSQTWTGHENRDV